MLAAPLDILVVDDDATTRAMLADLLRAWGAVVRTAGSAREAREAYAAERPDVLISDIGMPEEDGCALIRDLRAHDTVVNDNRLRAIAFTAMTAPTACAHALACGFDRVVGKPLKLHELLSALGQGAGIEGRWPASIDGSPARDS